MLASATLGSTYVLMHVFMQLVTWVSYQISYTCLQSLWQGNLKNEWLENLRNRQIFGFLCLFWGLFGSSCHFKGNVLNDLYLLLALDIVQNCTLLGKECHVIAVQTGTIGKHEKFVRTVFDEQALSSWSY